MSDPTTNVSPLVRRALERIPLIESRTRLLNLYENAERHETITEPERELVVAAVERRLREVSPGAANRLFGPKDAEAREFLEEQYRKSAEAFDLSGNMVKNGVKTGGEMLAGRKHVDVYISYKNTEGWHVSLSWLQDNAESDRYLRVWVYQGGLSNQESVSQKIFAAGEEEAAVARYHAFLAELVGS